MARHDEHGRWRPSTPYEYVLTVIVGIVICAGLMLFAAAVFGGLSGGAITAGSRMCPMDDCSGSSSNADMSGVPYGDVSNR